MNEVELNEEYAHAVFRFIWTLESLGLDLDIMTESDLNADLNGYKHYIYRGK